MLSWKQFRALGSCALALCDVAYGALDGYFDAGSVHAPWDYLGGYLICLEAGVKVVDTEDRPLGIADPNARRCIVAAGTPPLLQALRDGGRVTGLDLATSSRWRLAPPASGARWCRASFGDPSNVREKAPGDWVSDVDTASEHAVRDALAEGAPGIAFFGEESGGERAALGWLVDPLDGTANFLHGFPAVGVSIGLVLDGVPSSGSCTRRCSATRTARPRVAARPGTAGRSRSAPGRRARRSRPPGSRSGARTGSPPTSPVFHQAFEAVEDLRRAGAASLDLAWTAAGVFDGFFELALGPWDVAAGALLVREAGGVVTDWTGDPDAWLGSGDIVAAPPRVHARLLEITARATV